MTSTVWESTTTAGRQYEQAIGQRLALVVTSAAVLYNFVLCFVNTKLLGISPSTVIAAECLLIGMALSLIWNRNYTLYTILLLMAGYFYALMVFRFQFDPKILRDILIPIAFFFLGRHLGSLHSSDRLVTLLIFITLAVALFEWLAPQTYLNYFEVGHYYVARGTANEEQHQYFQGFFNSARFENRTLLPFLGDHRVSGIFLEAPSVGNFGAIVFAWMVLRPRRLWPFVAKAAAVAAVIVLADARLGLYFCICTLLLYVLNPVVRPTMLFVAPFLAMIGLVIYPDIAGHEVFNNDMLGRFLYAGEILSRIDMSQVFGLQSSDISTGVQFASDPVNDSAYTYVLVKVGILGAAALWGLFVYAPVLDQEAWRFKTVVASYYVLVLTIAASAFTVKTAALLWFLYGTLNNPERGDWNGTLKLKGTD